MILSTGVAQSYFHINGRKKQCGDYRYIIESGKLIIWPKEKNKQSPEAIDVLANVLDGNNSDTPFADEAAIETWLGENFFF
jgi:hypothetical protein